MKARFKAIAPCHANLERLTGVTHGDRPRQLDAGFGKAFLFQVAQGFAFERGEAFFNRPPVAVSGF